MFKVNGYHTTKNQLVTAFFRYNIQLKYHTSPYSSTKPVWILDRHRCNQLSVNGLRHTSSLQNQTVSNLLTLQRSVMLFLFKLVLLQIKRNTYIAKMKRQFTPLEMLTNKQVDGTLKVKDNQGRSQRGGGRYIPVCPPVRI